MEEGRVIAQSIRLSRPLGAGGMGSVWLADHLALETEVVVKFMHQALGEDPTSRERFSREAVAASRVKSPHVVQTFDHGVTPEGIPFIVMERLDGDDLAKRIEKGVVSLREMTSILLQVCKALARAHSVGVVHRDIKPDNIFLCDVGTDEPFVKLLDFGIAKTALNPKLDNKTRTGAMMGTPYYMSPEQFAGAREIDFRTDLWSLGIVAFEGLTGARPFDADTIGGLAIAVHSGELPLPSSKRPDAAVIDAWFTKACARKPADRHGSAKEFAETFAAAAAGAIGAGDGAAPQNKLVITGGAPLDPGPLSATSPVPLGMAGVPATTASLLMTTGASAAVESEPTPVPPKTSRTPLYAVAGGLGAFAIGIVILLGRKGPNAAASSAPSPAVAVPVLGAAAAAAPGAAPVSVGAPAQAALEQLAPLPAVPPVLAAPAAPLAAAAPDARPSAKPVSPAHSPAPAAVPAHATPAAAPGPAPAKPAVNCNPPFTIDAQGVKHPKMECL